MYWGMMGLETENNFWWNVYDSFTQGMVSNDLIVALGKEIWKEYVFWTYLLSLKFSILQIILGFHKALSTVTGLQFDSDLSTSLVSFFQHIKVNSICRNKCCVLKRGSFNATQMGQRGFWSIFQPTCRWNHFYVHSGIRVINSTDYLYFSSN